MTPTAHKLGDRVRWSSQARGSVGVKRGTVVAVLCCGDDPAGAFLALEQERRDTNLRPLFDMTSSSRSKLSYFVEVAPTGRSSVHKVYWPFASKLEKDNEK